MRIITFVRPNQIDRIDIVEVCEDIRLTAITTGKYRRTMYVDGSFTWELFSCGEWELVAEHITKIREGEYQKIVDGRQCGL